MSEPDSSQPEHSRQELIRAVGAHVAERLKRGEKPEDVRADLIAGGLSPEVADQFLAGFAPGKWEGGTRGWVLRVFGILVMFVGAFLIAGNRLGFFPTFPFAGTVTILAGAGMYVFGGGKG